MQSGGRNYLPYYHPQSPNSPYHQNHSFNHQQNDLLTGSAQPISSMSASAPPFSQYPTPHDFSPALPNQQVFQSGTGSAPSAPSFSHQISTTIPQFVYPSVAPESASQVYPPASPYRSYDQPKLETNYVSPYSQISTSTPNPNYHSSSYPHLSDTTPFVSEKGKFEQYGIDSIGSSNMYGQDRCGRTYTTYDRKEDFDEGAYRYDGGNQEPYGARGMSGVSKSSWSSFDDYGRSTASYSSQKEQPCQGKVVKAVPKADSQQDRQSGVQKFRVKLLPESSGQTLTDVLCQIGLDGIRMLDPNTNRTLRIYPLETLTKWEVTDPSIYTFWAKSSVDFEPRRIRIQSNSYTTNTILDTVTAATIQFKEIGGKDNIKRGEPDTGKLSDLGIEKKKGLSDWMNLLKSSQEEKDHWVPDEVVTKCTACGADFGAFLRKHHCRNCGDIFCDKCTQGRIALTAEDNVQPVRVCDRCMAEVSQRLISAREACSNSTVPASHEDLARKLQEVMEKNCKISSGSTEVSGGRVREVACPTCTVHLQVQVPASGSETIECGVCQHPFLVSAH